MSEPFLGEIRMFGGNFNPRGWALCNGQLLSISQNTALFSILGTTYGGNGQTTFGLPDLRGRVPVHFGQGAGLSSIQLGQVSGIESVTLTTGNLPAHTHSATATLQGAGDGTLTSDPGGKRTGPANIYSSSTTDLSNMAAPAITVGTAGGSQPFDNHQPYLCLNFIIALEGIYPSRN